MDSKNRAHEPQHAIRGDAALLRGGSAEFSRTVSYLIENLGLRLTTLAAGLRDARIVRSWAEGKGTPTDEQKEKLDILLEAFEVVTKKESSATARAFLIGMNPEMDDRAIVLAIANSEDLAGTRTEVMSAVNAFLYY